MTWKACVQSFDGRVFPNIDTILFRTIRTKNVTGHDISKEPILTHSCGLLDRHMQLATVIISAGINKCTAGLLFKQDSFIWSSMSWILLHVYDSMSIDQKSVALPKLCHILSLKCTSKKGFSYKMQKYWAALDEFAIIPTVFILIVFHVELLKCGRILSCSRGLWFPLSSGKKT